MKLVPSLQASSRPHMVLDSPGKTNAVVDVLILLLKLRVLSNKDVLYIPSVGNYTYYHKDTRYEEGCSDS